MEEFLCPTARLGPILLQVNGTKDLIVHCICQGSSLLALVAREKPSETF